MQLLNYTCETPEQNLALDEALLDEAESRENAENDNGPEVLRLWESCTPMVVVGRSSKVADEVNLDACRERGVPILRRSSGGAAIVAGPGCLMYAVVLSYRQRPMLRDLEAAHRFVMGTILEALSTKLSGVQFQGICDLTLGGKKFSGNSLRCRRDHFLYHGTLLYDFPLDLIATCLRMPKRQPEYRETRPHEAFVANLPLSRDLLVGTMIEAWKAIEDAPSVPRDAVACLVAEKYSQHEWNFKH